MSDALVFYHNPQSRSQMVHWMLEELGAAYETRVIDLSAGEQKSPDFLAINPMGKIPAIVHGGTVVTETGAIIAYLADAFPDAGLTPPPGDKARGTWLRWLFFGGTCFEPALIDKMLSRPEVERKGSLGYGSYEDMLGALKTALIPGPWILGERFSAADVYIGALIGWAMAFGAPDIKGEPVFEAYMARVRERPAFQRTIQLP